MKKYNFLEIIVIAILVILLVLIVLQVVSRYVFKNPIEWSEELARFLFIWLGFTSAAIALQEDQHVRFTYIIDKLPKKISRIINKFNNLLTMLFLIILIIYGAILSIQAHSIPSVTLSFVRWSYVYASLPIGLSLMLIVQIRKSMKNKNKDADMTTEFEGSKEIL